MTKRPLFIGVPAPGEDHKEFTKRGLASIEQWSHETDELDIILDLSPQLGGDLDANGFDIQFDDNTGLRDDSDNEQLIFQKTASAVNHWEMTNAAAGGEPLLQAVGGDTDVDARLSSKGAGAVQLAVNGTNEVTVTSTATSPAASDGNALGTTALMWADLFLASGGVINWNAGNATITHSAGLLTSNVDVAVPDEVYDATAWNGSLEVPTKNAVRDKFESLSPGGVTVNIQTFTTSGTYTPTAGMDHCIVYATGGGGGGGGADVGTSTDDVGVGGGGGAGGTAIEEYSAATIGASQIVTIGNAGTAGTTAGADGGVGGDTTFGALMTAPGGVGGVGSGTAAQNVDATAGGAGGVPTGGDVNIEGGDGDNGIAVIFAGDVGFASGGNGGASYWGGGGRGGAVTGSTGTTEAGRAGTAYGSGGGGGANIETTAGVAGGAGKAGVIVIYEYI
jgi:hypothetical protein